MQQPVNRVSHVVYCLEPDHLDEAARFLSEVLGAKFEDSSRPELGLRILVSLENGLELIAPAPDLGETPERFTRFLAERGEEFIGGATDQGNFPMAANFAKANHPVVRERIDFHIPGVTA